MLNLLGMINNLFLFCRDVKPENFLIGPSNTPKWATVQLIDMGFCKYYLTEENEHIPYVVGKVMEKGLVFVCWLFLQLDKPIAGTQRYMSINNHLGREISRRDDMEAILYMGVYLRKGQLPWRELQGTAIEKNRQTG